MSNQPYPTGSPQAQPYGQPQQYGQAGQPQQYGQQQFGQQQFGGQGFGPQGFGNAPGGFSTWGAPPRGGQGFPGQGFPGQGYPGQGFGGQQPGSGYPSGTMQPHGGGWQPPQQQQKESILPAVLIVVGALVAVLVLAQLLGGGGGPGGDDPAPGFKHDDYQIPPAAGQHPDLPWPSSDAEVEQWLTNNNLYNFQIAKPVRCELPAFNHVGASAEAKKAQLELALVCLVRFWGPTLEEAGFTITHPTVTMYDSPIQNACGKAETHNAFYCGVDQNLYFATDVHEIVGVKMNDPWVYESVMAHEFAHSVQGRTGIIPAKAIKADKATDEAGKLEPTRRNEAQADCLAGMFFNGVQESMGLSPQDAQGIGDIYGQIGNKDPNRLSSHPQPPTRQKWFTTGLTSLNISACNTYIASLEDVK
ncbi:neutral zinc metallopeptidase [Propionibacteriaceae bacterium Y1923]